MMDGLLLGICDSTYVNRNTEIKNSFLTKTYRRELKCHCDDILFNLKSPPEDYCVCSA